MFPTYVINCEVDLNKTVNIFILGMRYSIIDFSPGNKSNASIEFPWLGHTRNTGAFINLIIPFSFVNVKDTRESERNPLL